MIGCRSTIRQNCTIRQNVLSNREWTSEHDSTKLHDSTKPPNHSQVNCKLQRFDCIFRWKCCYRCCWLYCCCCAGIGGGWVVVGGCGGWWCWWWCYDFLTCISYDSFGVSRPREKEKHCHIWGKNERIAQRTRPNPLLTITVPLIGFRTWRIAHCHPPTFPHTRSFNPKTTTTTTTHAHAHTQAHTHARTHRERERERKKTNL